MNEKVKERAALMLESGKHSAGAFGIALGGAMRSATSAQADKLAQAFPELAAEIQASFEELASD